jgi:serralysin
MSYDAYQTSNPFDPNSVYDSSVDQRNWWADNGNNPQTLMMLDIAALQHMYGADYLTNPGKTDYKWDSGTGALTITENDVSQTPIDLSPTNNIFMTVWDGGGTDTYDFSGYTNPSVGISIDLRPGHWVTINDLALYNPDPNLDHSQRADLLAGTGEHFATGNIANALIDPGNPTETASLIENAIGGTGNDILIGNDVGNKLTGGDGSDILTGGAGNDFFVFNSVIGIDTITDFHTAIDRLQFDNSGAFAAAGSDGAISGDAFYATAGGFAGETPLDRFLYDTTNGNLYYDDDGSAADAPIQIALLNNHPALNYSDFQII